MVEWSLPTPVVSGSNLVVSHFPRSLVKCKQCCIEKRKYPEEWQMLANFKHEEVEKEKHKFFTGLSPMAAYKNWDNSVQRRNRNLRKNAS